MGCTPNNANARKRDLDMLASGKNWIAAYTRQRRVEVGRMLSDRGRETGRLVNVGLIYYSTESAADQLKLLMERVKASSSTSSSSFSRCEYFRGRFRSVRRSSSSAQLLRDSANLRCFRDTTC